MVSEKRGVSRPALSVARKDVLRGEGGLRFQVQQSVDGFELVAR